MNENVLEWITNKRKATLTISQPKYKNRIYELKERFPDDVDIRERYNMISKLSKSDRAGISRDSYSIRYV